MCAQSTTGIWQRHLEVDPSLAYTCLFSDILRYKSNWVLKTFAQYCTFPRYWKRTKKWGNITMKQDFTTVLHVKINQLVTAVACNISSLVFYNTTNLLWFLFNHRVNGYECNSTLWCWTMPGVQQQVCPVVRRRTGSGLPGNAARLGCFSAFCCTMQEQPELSYANACHCAQCCMSECLITVPKFKKSVCVCIVCAHTFALLLSFSGSLPAGFLGFSMCHY